MAKERQNPGPGKDGPQAADTRFDRNAGAIVGSPTGFRFATGRENVDLREVGKEMLRGRHEAGERDGS